MSTVFIARHGETDWNRDGRYQGRRESSLTTIGRRQAAALADALSERSIDRVITSPLQRTAETARAIADRAGVPLEFDERLIEIAHGEWEGRLRGDIERDEPELMRLWKTRPELAQFVNGEDLAAVQARWHSLAAELRAQSLESCLALITHDAVVRVALLDLGGRPLSELWSPRVVNGGYARCALGATGGYVLEECRDGHLSGIATNPALQAL